MRRTNSVIQVSTTAAQRTQKELFFGFKNKSTQKSALIPKSTIINVEVMATDTLTTHHPRENSSYHSSHHITPNNALQQLQ